MCIIFIQKQGEKMSKYHRWTKEEISYLKKAVTTKTYKEMSLDLGLSTSCVGTKCRSLGLKPKIKRSKKRNKITENNINKTGNILLEPLRNTYNNHKFRCKHCGKTFETKPSRIVSGHTKSCGCVSIGKRTGSKYLSGTWIDRTKRGASVRGYKFDVSLEFLDRLLEKQKFKCKLSGRNLLCGYIKIEDYTVSLDRIDSSKDYTEDNIQFLHKEVNMAKQSLSQENFIKLCKEISKHNE